ncbi:placenta growth factor isoform X1 [Canis lupus dingo]|uniref:placenta growth factor isoform X1 n=2 Tax=Canis lupus dingo TaxID=286419 RepID=UPI000DC66CC3|nr:placenta growth factor isoform X1 [Canis lupus dingo]
MSDYDDKQFNVEFQALTLRWIYSEGLDDSWDLMTWMVMLLAGLALPAMPPQQLALSAGNGSSEVEVVSFQQVWGRSYCRALEKLVDVLSEYPDEVEHMFNPSCVSLLRCSGCCGDENLHCMPVETANVTMQASNPSLPEAPDDPFYGPALLRGADLLSAHPLSVQASVGGYEARKPLCLDAFGLLQEETQGQGEEEEREAETHRLPPVRPYCSPEVTGPSEERRLAPAPVFITATLSYLPADTCPLFISQLYPC